MDVNNINNYCENPNIFSEAIEPTVNDFLPEQGSVKSAILEHTTGFSSLFSNIADDLCEQSRLGDKGKDSILSSIARASTSAAVLSGAVVAAVVGTPLAGVALGGLAALTVAPPLAEKAVFGLRDFATSLLDRTKDYIQRS